MDDEYIGLPADFDINDNIPTLTQQLKKVPLTTYFYNLLMRMELDKAKRDGRTWIWLVVVKMMSFISCVSMCGHMCGGDCDDDHVLVYNTFLIR